MKVVYHRLVVSVDIPSLDKTTAERIKRAIEEKISIEPLLYGTPLRATLKPYWKLRVGDWRVVYEIKNLEVRIMVIAHRKNVYDIAIKRN